MKRQMTIEEMEKKADGMIAQVKKEAEAPSTPPVTEPKAIAESVAPAAAVEPAPPAEEPVSTPEPVVEPAPEAVPPPPAPPEETIEELKARLATADKRYRDAQAALTPVQQERAELRRKNEEMLAEIARHKEARPVAIPPTPTVDLTDTEFAQFKVDYPEVATILEKQLAQKTADLEKRFDEKLTAREQKMRDEQMAEIVAERERVILEKHPDVADIAKSEEFQAWIDTQPARIISLNNQSVIVPPSWIRDNALAVDPEIVNELLGQFKESVKTPESVPAPKPPVAARVSVPAGAAAVATPRAASPRTAGTKQTYTQQDIIKLKNEIARMSPEAQEKALAEIDAALVSP